MIKARLLYKWWSETPFDSSSKKSVHGFGFDNSKVVTGKIDVSNIIKPRFLINNQKWEFVSFEFDERINGCDGVALTDEMILSLKPLDSLSAAELFSFQNKLKGDPELAPSISTEPVSAHG